MCTTTAACAEIFEKQLQVRSRKNYLYWWETEVDVILLSRHWVCRASDIYRNVDRLQDLQYISVCASNKYCERERNRHMANTG
jgi:hypothetical protein